MITDDLCIALFYENEKMIDLKRKRVIFRENPGIEDYLTHRFPDVSDTSEVLFRLKNHINEPPKCLCGKTLKYNKGDKKYNAYCSSKCQNSDPEKIKKDKLSKKERYGDENYNNKEKYVKTCIEKYGVPSFTQTSEFLEKTKNTNIKKYGTDWGLQNNEVKEKGKATKKERYGDENYNNRAAAELTSLKKYGVKNTKQWTGAKEKDKETCLKKYGATSYTKTEEDKNRQKETFLKHFGEENNTQSEAWKAKWYGNNEWVRNRCEHIFASMKKNGSFRESKPEKRILEFLREQYGNVIYQYKDEKRYPFRCDYYLPNLDIFIEYNGFWMHGGHPFDPTSENDLERVRKWKNSEKKSYLTAVKIWTQKDPLKRGVAKKNKLKFIELWYDDAFDLNAINEKITNIRYNN